jgi:hypothetical protein
MKTRTSTSEKIALLKTLYDEKGNEFFEIKSLKVLAFIRNLLYYNRSKGFYLYVNSDGQVKFPIKPNFLGMIGVYLEENKRYNRSKKDNKTEASSKVQGKLNLLPENLLPYQPSTPEFVQPVASEEIINRLKQLRSIYGQPKFDDAVIEMLVESGYSGKLTIERVF